ncbi:hypothetical protein [Nocardia sp. MW-W600-9]
MFEEWADQFDPPSYHVIEPPHRGMIDLGQLVMAPASFDVGGEDEAVVREGGQGDGVLPDLGLSCRLSAVHSGSVGVVGVVAVAVRPWSGVVR